MCIRDRYNCIRISPSIILHKKCNFMQLYIFLPSVLPTVCDFKFLVKGQPYLLKHMIRRKIVLLPFWLLFGTSLEQRMLYAVQRCWQCYKASVVFQTTIHGHCCQTSEIGMKIRNQRQNNLNMKRTVLTSYEVHTLSLIHI